MALSKAVIIKIATAEASRLLNEFEFSYTEPIDIFKIIEEKQIVLNFQKLDSLAGAYLPESPSSLPGILINENLPLTRQRYTAAHELCHFIRKDSTSFDTSSELFMNEYKRDEKEQIAEEFASNILMPRRLINNILEQIGVTNRDKINPLSVYELSLRMDTSYQASVNRLASLRMIKPKTYRELASVSPKTFKNIYGKEGLKTSWNNIWNIAEQDNGNIIYPLPGDEVRIQLKENPSTGYKWVNIPEKDGITTYWKSINENAEVIGAGGMRHIDLKIREIEEITLELFYNRPWLPKSKAINNFNIKIVIQCKRHGIKLEQLIA